MNLVINRQIPNEICSVPCDGARFVVTIDGKPYAGFADREAAQNAMKLWAGEIDGAGNPIPPGDRARRGWKAVRGRRLEVLERG